MKRLLQILVPAVLLLTACQKEKSLELGVDDPGTGGPGTGGPGTGGGGNNNTYFLECKIAGAAKTFNVELIATKETDGGETFTFINGYASDDPTDTEEFFLLIQTSGDLTTGIYKVTNFTSAIIAAGYQPSGGSSVMPFMTSTGFTEGTPFTINVTKVSSTEVEGTFSGSLFELDINSGDLPGPSTPTKSVADGKFRVKFE